MEKEKKVSSISKKNKVENTFIYIILTILCIIWVLPIIMIVLVSFNKPNNSQAMTSFTGFTFQHYIDLFVGIDASLFPFIKWLGNTLLIAVIVTFINTLFILSVSYTMSRLRFKGRKTLMSLNLILGMFPGFMSMIAVYQILTLIGLTNDASPLYNPIIALILCYSMSSGMGFYIAKGFFDTISRSLDEAARIDGASNAQVFFKIIVPLSKPIIVYTLVTSFIGPWMDYIYCTYILGENTNNFTVALGLYQFLDQTRAEFFTRFFAGSVIVSIPIMALFLATQKYYVEGVTGGAVKG